MERFFAAEKLVAPNPSARSSVAPTIALVGSPNSGKTTIYNALTGQWRDTGNRPGVTVECVEGRLRRRWTEAAGVSARDLVLVDLPGAYDLEGYTEDEAVTRDFLLSGRASAVLNVVDAANLERSLYLTVGLLEAGLPVVVALNQVDQARAQGLRPDPEALSRALGGVPVVATVGLTGEGLDRALEAAARLAVQARSGSAGGRAGPVFRVDYGPELATAAPEARRLGMAARRFELAAQLARACLGGGAAGEVAPAAAAATAAAPAAVHSATDVIDRVVTHRYAGVAVLLGVMAAVFKFTFAVGTPLTDLVSELLASVGRITASVLEAAGLPGVLRSFLVDGLLAGVGSVLVFVPLVFSLFFALAVLEETGYLARASCVTDRFMRALGLGGKAFIPLVLGFGCNVPAILAARTLENRRDRLVTILVTPFMSCSGRLPLYTLFAGAFFGARQGLVVFGVYLLGVLMAVLMARLVTARLLPGESPDLIVELPAYRWPSWRNVLRGAWWRTLQFIRKAGTIIAAGVAVMWVLASLPWGVTYAGRESLLGRLGSVVAVALRPAGLGDWETGAALVFGFAAKEFAVAALGLVHGAGEKALPALLAAHFTPLTALSFLVLTLLYTPCLATVAVIRKETGSWKWPALAVGASLLLGLTTAAAVYQVGRALGLAG